MRANRARDRADRRALAAAALAGVALLAVSGAAHAGVPLTLPDDGTADGGRILRWDTTRYVGGAVPYRVNPTSPPGAKPIAPPGSGDADRIAAARAGFQAWEKVTTATLRFRYLGTTADSNAVDLQNVVSFSPTGFVFPPAFPAGVFPIVTYALHAGPVTLDDGSSIDARFAGEILDADLVVNPQGDFTLDTAGPPPFGVFDLQGVLTHEIGHAIGLDHDGVAGTTMYGFFTPSGGFFGRTPEAGDRVALSAIYPKPSYLASSGRIRGVVTRSGGGPVFGAQVVALRSPTGVIAASTLTGVLQTDAAGLPSRFGASSGEFVLSGLAPGAYDLVAEPLDGPGLPYLSGVFGSGSGGASFVQTDFTPGSALAPVTVTANAVKTGVSIVVGPRTAAAPNLAAYAYGSIEGGPFVDPAQLPRGRPSQILLGAGQNLVSAGALLPGLALALQGGANGGVTLGLPSYWNGILVPVTVASNAALGPRLLVATTPSGVSSFAGALTVVAANPAPDTDGDGTMDAADSCPTTPNRDQADLDHDGVGDACDVCPHTPDPLQLDRGGIGAGSPPDGIGDACQCGDVNGDGFVTVADDVLIERSLLNPPTATLAAPELCDVGGGGAPCSLSDAVILRRALLAPPTETVSQRCEPAGP